MMRGVTGVVKDSLDRADAWVERLRIVGLAQRQGQQASVVDIPNGVAYPRPGPPPPTGSAESTQLHLDPRATHRTQETFSATTSVASSPIVGMVGLPNVNVNIPAGLRERDAGMLSPLGSANGGDSYFGGSTSEMSKLDLGGAGSVGSVEKSPVVPPPAPSRGGKKAMFADGDEGRQKSQAATRAATPVAGEGGEPEGTPAKRMRMDVDE